MVFITFLVESASEIKTLISYTCILPLKKEIGIWEELARIELTYIMDDTLPDYPLLATLYKHKPFMP